MIRHSILYFIVRVGNGIFAVATLAVFTRLMMPNEYGRYALALAAATVASSVLFQWLNVSVGRFYPAHRDNPEALMSAAEKGYLLSAGISALAFITLVPFHRELGLELGLITIIFLMTLAFGRYNMTLQLANARMTPARYGLLSWIKTGATLVAGGLLILAGFGEQGALMGTLIALVVAVLASHSMGGKRRLVPYNSDRSVFDQMLRYGLPLTLTFVSIMAVTVTDRLMIGWLLGAAETGPYAAAYDLTQQTIGVIMNVFFLAAFPAAVHALENEGDAAARTRLYSLGRAIVGIGLPSATGFAVLSPEIAQVIFGEAFREEAARIMPWIAAAIFVGAYKSYYLDTVYQLRRVTRHQASIALVMALANIAMNFVLLPRYGTLGAAWAALGAFSLGSAISWWWGRKLFRLPSMKNDIVKSVCASAVMVLSLFVLPTMSVGIGLAVKVAFGSLVFVAIAYIINLGGSRDWFRQRFGEQLGFAK